MHARTMPCICVLVPACTAALTARPNMRYSEVGHFLEHRERTTTQSVQSASTSIKSVSKLYLSICTLGLYHINIHRYFEVYLHFRTIVFLPPSSWIFHGYKHPHPDLTSNLRLPARRGFESRSSLYALRVTFLFFVCVTRRSLLLDSTFVR